MLNRIRIIIPTMAALIAALVVAAIMLIALNTNPLEAFAAMWDGAFGTQNKFAETLVKATPIMFVAVGITIAFRGGVINIGGEGQMITGAVIGTAVALQLSNSPGLVIIPAALVAAFVAGGAFGGIAGYLKAYFGVNEILSTIMLNQIAVQMMNFLLNGIMLDPATAGFNNIPKTARITEAAQLARISIPIGPELILFDRTRLHFGLVVAVSVAILVYVLLWRTTIGYRIRAVGLNQRASRYAGINVNRQAVLSMFLAGGLAGLAGVVQVLGLQYRLQTDGSPTGFTANAGFNGIVAALFGGLNPIGAIPASILFGGLLIGAQGMQRAVGIPASLVTAINGLIVVFVVSSQYWTRRMVKHQANALALPRPEAAEPQTPNQPATNEI
jgi:general nucleoside transport system permease protein